MASSDRAGEFTGKTRNNTVLAKDKGMLLKPDEQLRLLYLTGQTQDPTLEPTHRAWEGLNRAPHSVIDR